MDWELTPLLQNQTEIVSLQACKDVLRIGDSVQDDKITQQIKSAIEFFETKTGFILRAGTLKLNFDSKNLYNKRPVRKNYLADYTAGQQFFNSLVSSKTAQIKYILPLATTLQAQKPKSFSFNSSNQNMLDFVTLAQDEITALTDSFFFPVSQKPLCFILKSEELKDKGFDENSSNITMEIDVTAPRDFQNSGADIKRCIIRMVSKMFEFPDYEVAFYKDSIISQTCQKYNYQLGI